MQTQKLNNLQYAAATPLPAINTQATLLFNIVGTVNVTQQSSCNVPLSTPKKLVKSGPTYNAFK
jgi:hypothetical protein